MQGEKSKPQKPTAASRRPQTVPDVAVPCCPVLQFTDPAAGLMAGIAAAVVLVGAITCRPAQGEQGLPSELVTCGQALHPGTRSQPSHAQPPRHCKAHTYSSM